eukprot:scaffold61349_cov39-Tisochrysis_lutea.AAC.1
MRKCTAFELAHRAQLGNGTRALNEQIECLAPMDNAKGGVVCDSEKVEREFYWSRATWAPAADAQAANCARSSIGRA